MLALGCTEPIALAYAAAKVKAVLGTMPETIVAQCSGNIIKNVKCVSVPNAGTLKGIRASVLIGMLGGNPEKKLEVLSDVTDEQIQEAERLLQTELCSVEALNSDVPLHIIVKAEAGAHTASVEIKHLHTNITKITHDGAVIFEAGKDAEAAHGYETDRSLLNVHDIFVFAKTCDLESVRPLLDRQIKYNLRIAEEGLSGKYGIGIGKMLLSTAKEKPMNEVRAYAAAGSEARMSGCCLPVVINSGSGNQGIASSVPVIIYARQKKYSQEQLYRALVFSNLLTIHQKAGIGRLSAFCGAVSASCASGAAMTFLDGGSLEQIEMTITNTLADVSGIICDGAKPSCGAKIASGLDAAIMAHDLAMCGNVYEPNTGILKKTVENTISTVGRIGSQGMVELDHEILNIMLGR